MEMSQEGPQRWLRVFRALAPPAEDLCLVLSVYHAGHST